MSPYSEQLPRGPTGEHDGAERDNAAAAVEAHVVAGVVLKDHGGGTREKWREQWVTAYLFRCLAASDPASSVRLVARPLLLRVPRFPNFFGDAISGL